MATVYRADAVAALEGSFRRVIRLPDGVDAEAITASSKDGILTVRIPKNPQVLPRKVKIEIEK